MNNDLISREALKKAIMHKTGVAEETWEQLYDSVLEEIDSAPAVEDRPTGDMISREALKKAFEDCTGDCACCVHNTNDFEYCGLIDNAPTVEPFEIIGAICNEVCGISRPQSEWGEPFERSGKTYHQCSCCHISIELILFDNFCPNCGADMRGSKE